MKAAVFYGSTWPQTPMAIEEVPKPTVGPNDVLVKVAACGMCRTDLEYLKGEIRTPKAPPIILGHEPSGTVVEVGAEVPGIEVGQKVLIATLIPCRSCQMCRKGRENLCSSATIVGANRDGAFAEYVVSPAVGVYQLPDNLPLEESAVITDAVGTAYHAIYQRADVRPGDIVAVYGASGGLGLMCVQFASAIGANVVAVGRKMWKLEKAKELGAKEIISSEEVERLDKAIIQTTGGGADISVDVTGIPEMIETAFRATKPGGTVVIVGFSPHKIQLTVRRLMWFEITVMGSRVYNPMDMPKILDLVEKGIIDLSKTVSHHFKLEEINEAYQMLDRGEILRGIIVP